MPVVFARLLFLILGFGPFLLDLGFNLPALAQSSGTIQSTPLPDLDPNAPPPAAPPAPAAPATPAPATPAPAPQPATPAAPVAPPAPAMPLPMGALESPAMAFPDVVAGMSIAPEIQQGKLPDSFTMIAKPALVLHGQSTWDNGYQKLKDAFDKLKSSAQSAGMVIIGHPVTIFIATTENDFRFDAMLPIDKVPNQLPANFPIEIHIGSTPSGHAMRFVHQAPYDEIDNAYEQITAYLDAKEIDVRDSFIEEYVMLGATDKDPATTINIVVQPKD
jgi:effector-binding domain-containing protein